MAAKLCPINRLLLLSSLFVCLLQPQVIYADQHNPEIDYQQAQTLMRAAGQIYLHQQLTLKLLSDCGSKYKHLADSAQRARQIWEKDNSSVFKQSQHIQELVAGTIQKEHTNYDAVKFTMEIETLINQSVSEFRDELANRSRKQRHYLCNRLILSVAAGEWDLRRKIPDDVDIISGYKE